MKTLSEGWLAIREDALFAYKSLMRVPTYTATVVLTLALAIGGLTAVFSVLYVVVLRAPPFPRPQEIITIHETFVNVPIATGSSPNEFLDIRSKSSSFATVAALTSGSANLTGHGDAVRVAAEWVTSDMLRLLGVPPALGRDFAPGEDQPGAAPVAILTSAFHRRAFAGAPDVIGKIIELDGKPHTIIGVLPPLYDRQPRLGDQAGEDMEPRDVWVPLTFSPRQLDPRSRGERYIQVFCRMKRGVTMAEAKADIERLGESFYRDFPDNYKRETHWHMWIESLQSYGAGKSGLVLSLLLGAVTLVLLAACANVVSITLARLASRRREIAVRVALGASAGRIAGQFLVESIMLAVAAGVFGVIIGRAGMDGLLAAATDGAVQNVDVSFQWPVLAFALVVSVVTGVVAGAAPAWHAARLSPTVGLREGGRSTSGSAIRLRSALVVAQVTVALVLLVGTGMMLRSIVNLTATSPGFEPRGAYVAQVALAEPRYAGEPSRRRFTDDAIERLRAIPGIEAVGLTSLLPLSGYSDWSFSIEGDPRPVISPSAQLRMVGGDYFRALGIRLVAGRDFNQGDTQDTPFVGIISQLTADKFFQGRNPIGTTISFGDDPPGKRRAFTIVGIVANTREMGMDEPIQPLAFVPFAQWPRTSAGIIVRAPQLGASVLPAIRAAIAAVDPTQPVYGAVPLQSLVDTSLGSRRFTLLLLSVFAVLGLALAVLGIYGITSYSVVQRTQELAVRMAMGADDVAIVRLVLVQALRLVGIGLFLGAVLAGGLGKYLASLIYGLSPWDPQAVGLIAALMVVSALIAGWVPARRAAALPLANALRTE
jgi:predicted permease